RCPRPQHVKAHAGHDRRQPRAQVVDATDIGAAQADPGFLDSVIDLADRSEHAVCDRPHHWPVRFELLAELVGRGHRSKSFVDVRQGTGGRDDADVTGPAPMEDAMKIKLTSIYVDDQEKALRFYTELLGFAKKADFSNGPYRWLTVASPE